MTKGERTVTIATGAIIVAAVGTMLIAKNSNVKVATETSAVTSPTQLTEIESVETAIKTSKGKLVHVFGVRNDKNAAVVDSVHGKTIVLDPIPKEATCNVLLDAKVISAVAKSTKVIQGKTVSVLTMNREVPDIPKLTKYFGVISWPVEIPDSCNKDGKCLWEILLRGEACKVAGEDAAFVSSSPREFSTLSSDVKDRAKALPSWVEKE